MPTEEQQKQIIIRLKLPETGGAETTPAAQKR
jgi:hypothetical protein